MRASGYDREENDWYVESAATVRAFLRAEDIPTTARIHDPCCGGGNIPRTAIEMGYRATGSDIVDRGYGTVADALTDLTPADVIVTNPPYGIIEPVIRRCLERAPTVCILARLAFLEGRKRALEFWPQVPLRRIWVSGRRLSMPPGGKKINAKNGSIAYAWFVFSWADINGEPTVGWLTE